MPSPTRKECYAVHERLIRIGYIRRAEDRDYYALVLIIRNPDDPDGSPGTGRFVVEPNNTWAPEANQLPSSTDVLEELILAELVSAYYITDGNGQCGLADDSNIGRTAFQSQTCQWEWACLPQERSVGGLCTQGRINQILRKYHAISSQVQPVSLEQENSAIVLHEKSESKLE